MRTVLLAAAALTLATNVSATPVVDQGFDPLSGGVTFGGGVGPGDYQVAQTFTVGLHGVLAGVDVFVNATVLAGDLHLYVVATTGGLPVPSLSDAAISVSIPAGTIPIDPPHATAFHHVPTGAFNLAVVPGDVLAIVLTATGNYGFGGLAANPYSNGQFYERQDGSAAWLVPSVAPNADMGFRTYVELPVSVSEPATTWWGPGAVGLLLAALRRSA